MSGHHGRVDFEVRGDRQMSLHCPPGPDFPEPCRGLKIKLTQTQECVIGGYTDPKGSREHFGSLVLGLYDDKQRLIPVGQAGSGFTEQTHAAMWQRLKKLETKESPFFGKPDSPRGLHYVRPELVAEIKFTEWTHGSATQKLPKGAPPDLKMRAPVFEGLRWDKAPRECVIERAAPTEQEVRRAENGDDVLHFRGGTRSHVARDGTADGGRRRQALRHAPSRHALRPLPAGVSACAIGRERPR